MDAISIIFEQHGAIGLAVAVLTYIFLNSDIVFRYRGKKGKKEKDKTGKNKG